MSTTHAPNVDEWHSYLAGALAGPIADVARLVPLEAQPLPVGETLAVDAVLKFLAEDSQGNPIAVALCASPASPGLVARGMRNAREAKSILGPDLGSAIMPALWEGELRGLTCGVLPYCQPFSRSRVLGRVQRRLLRPGLIRWLRELTSTTVIKPDSDALDRDFARPLAALAAHEQLPDPIRNQSRQTLDELQKGRWAPRFVLAHNDLWAGNVLVDSRRVTDRRDRPWRERFVVIDWPGAAIRGYPLLDLITLARSFGLAGRPLRDEIQRHCRYLDCEVDHARRHLLTGIGGILMKLEHMPLPMFIRMASKNLELLDSVVG